MRNRGHFLMIKELKYQEYTTIINVYVPINRPSKYMKQNPAKLKGKRDKPIVIGEYHQTLQLVIDRH